MQVADAPKDIVQVVPATKHRRLKSLGRCFALRTVHCAVEVVAANIAIDEAQVRDKEIANGPAGSPLMQPAAAREQGTVAHPDRRLGPSNKHLIDGSRRQASGLAFRSLAAEACLSEMLSRVFSCALRVNVWGVLYLEPLIVPQDTVLQQRFSADASDHVDSSNRQQPPSCSSTPFAAAI